MGLKIVPNKLTPVKQAMQDAADIVGYAAPEHLVEDAGMESDLQSLAELLTPDEPKQKEPPAHQKTLTRAWWEDMWNDMKAIEVAALDHQWRVKACVDKTKQKIQQVIGQME